MKKYVMLVLASTFIFNVATIAQEQTPPQGRRSEKKEFKQEGNVQVSSEKRAERMATKLGLTNAEKVKVQELFEKQDAKRDQHLAEIKKLREVHLAKFQNERKVQDAELEKIIGSDKFQKLENERTARKANIANRREGNQSHQFGKRNGNKDYNRLDQPIVSDKKRAEKIAKVLDLTDAQEIKVQALFEKQKAKREIRQTEVKKFRDEQFAKIESERKLQNIELEKIIGTEKFQKLENKRSEMKANLKERRNENQASFQSKEHGNKIQKEAQIIQATPEKRAEKMTKILGLTESQKTEVQSLFEKQEGIRQQQIQKVEKMRNQLKTQFDAQRKTNDEALAKIIGTEKFQKYQILRADRKDKIKDKIDMHKNHSPKNNIENN